MTQQEIEGNNILLAEFLGLEFNPDFGMFYVPIAKEEYNADSLKFHTDWNFLMLVVDKIESLESVFTFDMSFNKYTKQTKVLIQTYKGDFFKIELYKKSKIEATYNSCVEFVKWYSKK